MARSWYLVRSRGFWVVALGFFLGLELVLRIKLGSIYVMAAAWVLAHQWLAVKLESEGAENDQARQLIFALYSALIICAWIFLVFGVCNIVLRTVDNNWMWFQLP